MNQKQKTKSQRPPSPKNKGIFINDINYSYSITKSEGNEDSLLLKLFNPDKKSNVYFTYESPMEKLIKEVKFLSIYETLDEIIEFLKDIINEGDASVEEKDGVYSMEFKVNKKKFSIQLTKNEMKQVNESKNEKESRLDKLEKNYKDLSNKLEELKVIRKNEIKDIVKEVIFDKDIKSKLFEEMKQMFSSSSSSESISKNKNESENDNTENKIINKVNELIKNKEDKINNQINMIQKQLDENINYINDIIPKNYNYIILQVKIDEKDLNKDIILFNQIGTYKYYCNFERDDIEIIIDNKIVNIKYKNSDEDFYYENYSRNCDLSQKIEYILNMQYKYYWNFTTTGIHTVKIIFNKKLLQCNYLFSDCNNIYKIDCSNFDCSQIVDCSSMFYECSSLIEINLGKLDFALSKDFSHMFRGCKNLEKLDVSYLNTNNSKSFESMFYGCSKLKEINVSKFKTINCQDISYMFYNCSSLESIDMLYWDMENIKDINYLFGGCSNLKNIKMNFNNNNNLSFQDIFEGLPEELLKELPVGWNITQE